MTRQKIRYSNASTEFYFDAKFSLLTKLCSRKTTNIVTDDNVFAAHKTKFRGWNVIVLKPGEEFKVQATADAVIEQLIALEAGRDHTLVGVGGGVVTDLAGYVASVYLRGIRVGFVPTTILGLVDASIGGKNGIDVNVYKNLVGTIRQPDFILHDLSFLSSLPENEWRNGFAEVIKHAAITDSSMFRALEKNDLSFYQADQRSLATLVRRNVLIKTGVVQRDEFEKNERRKLNFGHTIGHAIESQYELLHGEAISIGMVCAAHISEEQTGFGETGRLVNVLQRYGLPTYAKFNAEKIFSILKMDKKRKSGSIHYILLDSIGKSRIMPLTLAQIRKFLLSTKKW
jgi:3-dehydroquinate synthase